MNVVWEYTFLLCYFIIISSGQDEHDQQLKMIRNQGSVKEAITKMAWGALMYYVIKVCVCGGGSRVHHKVPAD